ncbi:MAG: hypothetical protein FVQ80_04830 [Planctomycetes bacterium]|nr:hypothetical protein [Planctomycetota bacterium]
MSNKSSCEVRGVCFLVVVLSVLLTCSSVFGSASGLNNIPTTDIVPKNVLVLQSWVNINPPVQAENYAGFKYGLFEDVEIGIDTKTLGDVHGHTTLQVKKAFDIEGKKWRGVVGVANISEHREDQGYIFPYVATSYDIDVARLHFGYAGQKHNEAFFGGIDKMVTFFDRNLQLRADGIHINDKDDMLFSAGFLYELGFPKSGVSAQNGLEEFLNNLLKNVILESWVSKSSTGDSETYTIKLNYVIAF